MSRFATSDLANEARSRSLQWTSASGASSLLVARHREDRAPRTLPVEPLPVRFPGLETTCTPDPVVLAGETIRRQQKLQRRILALLHRELLNGGLHLRGVNVHS